jgi:excisionase family DNA binding protein
MLQNVTDSQNKIAYSVDELAEATSLSKVYLRKQIADGKLKAKKVGRRLLILQSQVDEYLNKFADAEPKNGKKQ